MQAQAATGFTATPEASFTLVGREVEAMARTGLQRFEQSIQSILEAPLDTDRVLEWIRLRTMAAGA